MMIDQTNNSLKKEHYSMLHHCNIIFELFNGSIFLQSNPKKDEQGGGGGGGGIKSYLQLSVYTQWTKEAAFC